MVLENPWKGNSLIGTVSIKKIIGDNLTFILEIHGTNIYTLVVLLLDQLPFKNDTKHASQVIAKKIPGSSYGSTNAISWDLGPNFHAKFGAEKNTFPNI